MQKIEFDARVSEVGDFLGASKDISGVLLCADDMEDEYGFAADMPYITEMQLPEYLVQQLAKHLYGRVKVTIELIADGYADGT